MTIQDIKNRLAEVHPHQYSDPMIIAWVNDVERDISMYLRMFDGLAADESVRHDELTDEVMLEEPDIYVEYLISRICLANEEYDRYNNHAALFDVRYAEWKDRYLRAHEPINRGTFKL